MTKYIMMDTLGALVGYGIAKLILKKSKDVEDNNKDMMKLIIMILIIGLVIIFVRYPLMAFLVQFLND